MNDGVSVHVNTVNARHSSPSPNRPPAGQNNQKISDICSSMEKREETKKEEEEEAGRAAMEEEQKKMLRKGGNQRTNTSFLNFSKSVLSFSR